MLNGETASMMPVISCNRCDANLPLRICSSAAGWYIGYYCPNCGPYSRETDYFADYAAAKRAYDIAVAGGTVPEQRHA